MLNALIFDVDGTLADTERDGHRPAFNAAFREAGERLDAKDLQGRLAQPRRHEQGTTQSRSVGFRQIVTAAMPEKHRCATNTVLGGFKNRS